MEERLVPPEDSAGKVRVRGASTYLYACVTTAAIGSFLFGYNTASIAGASLYMRTDRALGLEFDDVGTRFKHGCLVSCILLGAFVGALGSSACADRYGRRKVFLLNSVLYIVGPLGMALAPSFWVVVAARALTGISVGVSSSLANLYISEIAPAAYRGRHV
jgi:MFS family permease